MRQFCGHFLAMLGLMFSELGHQSIHWAEWCLDHDGRADCPNCIKEPPDAYL